MQAVDAIHAFEPYNVFWYEEPLPPHDMDGYRELTEKLDIRIATGACGSRKFL